MSQPVALSYPHGWFALSMASELEPGRLLTRRLAGRELVLFRTSDGMAVALDAFCPHLGAHMGHGGCVKDDTLVCPFHGFRFDRHGTCVATGYGTRPPRSAAVQGYPTAESGGWVFVWFHPHGAAPTWGPPPVDMRGYTPLLQSVVELRTHPQETTENSVDLGHFAHVHGYREMTLRGIESEGPYLHTRYGFVRPEGFPGIGKDIPIEIAVHVWGLGYSYVEVDLPTIGLQSRQYVLPTAVGPGLTELRLGMILRRAAGVDWRLGLLPEWIFARWVARAAHRTYVGEVMQDRAVWENKIHVERPLLADGDGPIGRYRAWCRQFYTEGPA